MHPCELLDPSAYDVEGGVRIVAIATLPAVAVLANGDAAGSGSRLDRSAPMVVRHVYDGDTIDVVGQGRVRLLGIDAPEIGGKFECPAPFALESKRRLTDLVHRRWIRLESEGTPVDKYDRRLAYVFREDGMFVNVVLVREGFARVSSRQALRRLEELQRAEKEARSWRRGIWSRSRDP